MSLDNVDINECLRNHGRQASSGAESTDSGKSEFDEEYFKHKPPPIDIKKYVESQKQRTQNINRIKNNASTSRQQNKKPKNVLGKKSKQNLRKIPQHRPINSMEFTSRTVNFQPNISIADVNKGSNVKRNVDTKKSLQISNIAKPQDHVLKTVHAQSLEVLKSATISTEKRIDNFITNKDDIFCFGNVASSDNFRKKEDIVSEDIFCITKAKDNIKSYESLRAIIDKRNKDLASENKDSFENDFKPTLTPTPPIIMRNKIHSAPNPTTNHVDVKIPSNEELINEFCTVVSIPGSCSTSNSESFSSHTNINKNPFTQVLPTRLLTHPEAFPEIADFSEPIKANDKQDKPGNKRIGGRKHVNVRIYESNESIVALPESDEDIVQHYNSSTKIINNKSVTFWQRLKNAFVAIFICWKPSQIED